MLVSDMGNAVGKEGATIAVDQPVTAIDLGKGDGFCACVSVDARNGEKAEYGMCREACHRVLFSLGIGVPVFVDQGLVQGGTRDQIAILGDVGRARAHP